MKPPSRTRKPTEKLTEPAVSPPPSPPPKETGPRLLSRAPPRPPRPPSPSADSEGSDNFEDTEEEESDAEENSGKSNAQKKKDAGKKIAVKLKIPSLPTGSKASSVPRHKKGHSCTPMIAPEKDAWGAPQADNGESVEMPEWSHAVFEPLERTPHATDINLPGNLLSCSDFVICVSLYEFWWECNDSYVLLKALFLSGI
jgi:hypothetical protein